MEIFKRTDLNKAYAHLATLARRYDTEGSKLDAEACREQMGWLFHTYRKAVR